MELKKESDPSLVSSPIWRLRTSKNEWFFWIDKYCYQAPDGKYAWNQRWYPRIRKYKLDK